MNVITTRAHGRVRDDPCHLAWQVNRIQFGAPA